MKPNLLVSLSGGETSAFMTWWIWNHWQDLYNIVVEFSNTGDENEATLAFIKRFSEHFGIPVVWLEAKVDFRDQKGTSFKVVNFETASRKGEPFIDVVAKYGLPNSQYPHCTRELKQRPLQKYPRSLKWKTWYTAIGIRSDEIDRMSKDRISKKLLYPLISNQPMTKPMINFWWSQQPFRLELKGYQGNCKACWKKSDIKLFQIAKDTPEAFDVFKDLESKFSNYIPESRLKLMATRNELPTYPVVSYRGNRSVKDIIEQAKTFNGDVIDDSLLYDLHNESCEVFSDCGTDN